jgi:hypothetical protein
MFSLFLDLCPICWEYLGQKLIGLELLEVYYAMYYISIILLCSRRIQRDHSILVIIQYYLVKCVKQITKSLANTLDYTLSIFTSVVFTI